MMNSQAPKLFTAAITVLVALLLVMAGSSSAFFVGRSIATWMGMSEIEYYRDSVVAIAAIVIHLTLDRFLHHFWRSTRCVRAYVLHLIRYFLTRR